MQSISELLGSDGPLSRYLPGFAPRSEQQAMAESVAEALAEKRLLIAEAGTGTGKTYAYLVPALLYSQASDKKVMISTGTKNLQDQLYHRDLPAVREALGISSSVALLKGRANYFCHHRFEMQVGRRHRAEQQDQLARIRSWSGRTDSGDIAELSEIPEDAAIWPQVTSTTDNCLGNDCPAYTECFVVKARKSAQAADLLVVNHHLFFADLALRDEGFGEVLPGVNAFIFDEAHQLPEVAGNFFGVNLSGRQLQDLGRDCLIECRAEAPDDKSLEAGITLLEKSVREFRLALGVENRRSAWALVSTSSGVSKASDELFSALNRLTAALEVLAERGKGLERCWRRSLDLHARLSVFVDEPEPNSIQWFDAHQRGFVLHMTPLEINETFRAYIDSQKSAWIFTSATLAVGESFTHFARAMGIEDATSERWDSPFDYQRQALCYVPKAMPEPNAFEYTGACLEAALPVIQASGGRSFFLVTSYRALNQAAEWLADKIDYPLLVQGTLPRGELLSRFRELGNAVLVGTSSFWEGVDVRGEALSCVIIDKLPFSSPGDPVLQARLDAMRERGLNPFVDHQLPQAVIALKQGVGRLIRDVHDRGVLMICDPRLYSKSYGRIFRDSLPPMPLTREQADVEGFFARGSI